MASKVTTATSKRRAGAPSDAIDRVIPAEVIEPGSTSELAIALREGSLRHETMVFTGNRTKIDWGLPPERLDLVVSVAGLPATIEHEAADLVVRVSASVSIDTLQQVLARAGQRLAIDEMVPGTTIGGLLSTGISGPLRYGFGAVRDLVIGTSLIRADGVVARSGGRVVKNVAGFDLAKLFTGSYGTLGCITEAFFRLHALPQCQRYVMSELTYERAEEALAMLAQTQTAPSAIECHLEASSARIKVGVLVEGMEQSTILRAKRVASLLGEDAELFEQAPRWWGLPPGNLIMKCTSEVSKVARVIAALRDEGRALGLSPTISGSAGVGAYFVGLDIPEVEPFDKARNFIERARALAVGAGGSAVVLRAPRLAKDAIDVYGPTPAIAIMRRVKHEFDPERLLAPGRFVGGI